MAYAVNTDTPLDILSDDSESTCIETDSLDSTRDFVLKHSTTDYYQRMTPGITLLVYSFFLS